jgi:hypothetical protein
MVIQPPLEEGAQIGTKSNFEIVDREVGLADS